MKGIMLDSETIDNYNKIYDIVKKAFPLSEDSLSIFKEKLFNPEIDKIYKNIIKDSDDLRIRFPISNENLYLIDLGWKKFKLCFGFFCSETGITYEEYRNNLIKVGKTKIKLKKAIQEFYLRNYGNIYILIEELHRQDRCYYHSEIHALDTIKELKELKDEKKEVKEKIEEFVIFRYILPTLDYIGTLKIPVKSSLELVFSLNFADWMLSATKEEWTSCLNLESTYEGVFWLGFPGLIGDKNRAMIYITDNSKKIYRDIITDRILYRSWILLDNFDNLNIVKFFPKNIVNNKKIEDISNINTISLNDNYDFVSKNPIQFLYFKNNKCAFIYQDLTIFNEKGHMVWNENEKGGFYYVYKNSDVVTHGHIFNYVYGLRGLLKDPESINKEINRCKLCDIEIILEGEGINVIGIDGEICENCYNNNTFICDNCERTCSKDSLLKSLKGEDLCALCYDKLYFICYNCSKVKNKNTAIHTPYKTLCQDCANDEEINNLCEICHLYYNKDDMVLEQLCKNCSKGLFHRGKNQF